MPSAERRRQIVGGLTRPSPIAALLYFSFLRRIIGPDSFPRIRITKAVFMSHRFTIGVEEEFQIIDPISGELRSHVSELIAASSAEVGEQIKPELHQSIVEMGTKICNDVAELRPEIYRMRGELVRAADRAGLHVAAAGTHPFSSWIDQVISPGERYNNIVEELQQLARSLLIFGIHVHVAMPDQTTTIDLMNQVRYFLPHLLALSTSSPFWMGRDTGLKSYRTTIFRRFPRTGVPEDFGSWSEYENYIKLLVDLHCIDNAKKIWWDVRPHPMFGTLEFRICDVPTSAEDSITLAALTQALVVKLHRLYSKNQSWRLYPRALIEENKWRAVRWGLDGKLIDFGKRTEVPMRDLALEILEFVDDVLDDLGSRQAVEGVHRILKEGTSAEHQLQIFKDTGSLQAVVKHLVTETRRGTEQRHSTA
jgi:glutamate---cysteine ligase / carboxylate-amine ligase